MKAYVINLDRAVGRWKRVGPAMDRTGISYERFAAVDGKKIQLPNPQFAATKYMLYHGKRPNAGQIGCYLSHIAVMRHFLASSDAFAVICEDDIDPDPDLRAIIHAAMQFQSLWDVLRLSGFHDPHPMRFVPIGFDRSLAVNLTRLCGTGCYVVSRRAAEVLVERLLPMRVPIDHAIDREWFYGLRSLSVDPLPVRQNLPGIATSIPAETREKLPAWRRYWTVFPYRAANESLRLATRLRQYAYCRRAVASTRAAAEATREGNPIDVNRAA